MSRRVFVQSCGWLAIRDGDGTVYQGADQDWFPRQIQRWSGCGPTTAALALSYLAARPAFSPLWPQRCMEREPFARFMCQVWDYVTPGAHGLNRPELFQAGVEAFARDRGVALRPQVLEIPAARTRRPSFEAVSAFVGEGLQADCPVAFLNLSNGKVADLDRWHWVTIAGLDGPTAHILDSGRAFPIDLALWHETSKKRGGFVRLLPGAAL